MYSLVCDHEHTVSYGSPREVVHIGMRLKALDRAFLPTNTSIVFELKAWLLENIGYQALDTWQLITEKQRTSSTIYLIGIQFYEKKHAALFKLRWNGVMVKFDAGNFDITEI